MVAKGLHLIKIMEKNLLTCGQLERNLAQGIQKLYRQELEHSPSKVTCQLFGNQLAIVIENSLTAVEQTLASNQGLNDTVEKLTSAINQAIEAKLKKLIEDILSVQVEDILFDTTIETKRTGAIVALSQLPQVRNPESIPKNNSNKKSEKQA